MEPFCYEGKIKEKEIVQNMCKLLKLHSCTSHTLYNALCTFVVQYLVRSYIIQMNDSESDESRCFVNHRPKITQK